MDREKESVLQQHLGQIKVEVDCLYPWAKRNPQTLSTASSSSSLRSIRSLRTPDRVDAPHLDEDRSAEEDHLPATAAHLLLPLPLDDMIRFLSVKRITWTLIENFFSRTQELLKKDLFILLSLSLSFRPNTIDSICQRV